MEPATGHEAVEEPDPNPGHRTDEHLTPSLNKHDIGNTSKLRSGKMDSPRCCEMLR